MSNNLPEKYMELMLVKLETSLVMSFIAAFLIALSSSEEYDGLLKPATLDHGSIPIAVGKFSLISKIFVK